jgi:phosphoenolpyruvate carboxykinase (GTP)
MASETTAAASGAVGVVRRDPMAMLPFIGYHIGDYLNHWLEMGKKIKKQPKIFNVNWFRLDENGNFAWPGFGDNMRVLDWILKRAEETVDAVETPIGYLPKPEDINLDGSGLTTADVAKLLEVDKSVWATEAEGIGEFYKKIDDNNNKLPDALRNELEGLKARVK